MAANPPLTPAFLADLNASEQSKLLLMICNKNASARELVDTYRTLKDRKFAEVDLDFSWDVSAHTRGIEDHYGHLDRFGGMHGDDDSDDDGMDPDDRMWDVTIPEALKEIERSVNKIIKMTLPGHSFKNKKHAAESIVGIASAVLESDSELAEEMKGDMSIYECVFDKGLAFLLAKFSKEDLEALKSDGFVGRLDALEDKQTKNSSAHRSLQRHLAPIRAMF